MHISFSLARAMHHRKLTGQVYCQEENLSRSLAYAHPRASVEPANHDVQRVKRRIHELSGSKNGLDRSTEQKKYIARIASKLGEEGRVDQLDLTGSRWKLIFTESTASSSGKVGPFIGRTEQEFPADKPGQYINWLYLWPVKASLLANYKQSTAKRIDVSFVELEVQAGFFRWKKELNNRGTWDAIYIDDELRVFKANNKNLFVLERIV